ncbi:TetR/AcrR family transcriptional regulator [Streptomyces boncukensis]|uniref:TetR/AcrR family transcriptional regulator n=1 Tax=Streptomyces boncukensis TaxID=2711219 RepID=A0A6G4WSF2_9ACTN|nr:TetR/AcrR family transcriptional regulator [Streptomyces boncukensis]NGO67570.1 TetR/AcrR family transcriptional regulator [Streptomyces boncukensis]
MSRQSAVRARPLGGRADKRAAILAGALAVFARDGYSRASIDAISAEGGVSTRTIYNHFADKARLFEAVIEQSAAAAAADQIALIERHLDEVAELEPALTAFGRAWTVSMDAHAAHFSLVSQVDAEPGHVPEAALAAWQEAGPLRVRRELAARLRKVADRGLLSVPDPDRAALHLLLLVSADSADSGGLEYATRGARTESEIAESVAAGVHTFLYGYVPR